MRFKVILAAGYVVEYREVPAVPGIPEPIENLVINDDTIITRVHFSSVKMKNLTEITVINNNVERNCIYLLHNAYLGSVI